MLTKERGLVRNILASNEASGQQFFINAAVTPQPSRDLGKEGRQAGSVSPPLSQPWPWLTLISPPGSLSFYLFMSKSLLQVKRLPLPQNPQGFT